MIFIFDLFILFQILLQAREHVKDLSPPFFVICPGFGWIPTDRKSLSSFPIGLLLQYLPSTARIHLKASGDLQEDVFY